LPWQPLPWLVVASLRPFLLCCLPTPWLAPQMSP
jgi:hypothetical protein